MHRLPRPRICWRRSRRSTFWCTACRVGFGHVAWCVIVRAPLAMARGIASSTKRRAQRRCTLHEQDTCTYAVSSTNPWQMLHITRLPLPSRVALLDNPPPYLAGLSHRATTIASFTTSSRCCWSALLSASSTGTVALHAGQRSSVVALTRGTA